MFLKYWGEKKKKKIDDIYKGFSEKEPVRRLERRKQHIMGMLPVNAQIQQALQQVGIIT